MKIYYLSIIIIILLSQKLLSNPKIKTSISRYSYAVGHNGGRQLKKQNIDIDIKAFVRGFSDALNGEKPVMSRAEIKLAISEMYKIIKIKRDSKAKENIRLGEKFLENNRLKQGVKVTASGLHYEVIKEGKGSRPAENDIVKVHYRGYFIDGKEFDSSYRMGKAPEFIVSKLIKGWTEGLQLMSKGSKYKFVIPSKLAYGRKGNSVIPGNSVLIFEIELLEILGGE